MTSTDLLVTGVIGALFAPPARLYEINAAFGVVIVCVAFATTMEVMMATTVAIRMTPGRENFWICIVIAFILGGFLSVLWVFMCGSPHRCYRNSNAYVDLKTALVRPNGAPQNRTAKPITIPTFNRTLLPQKYNIFLP